MGSFLFYCGATGFLLGIALSSFLHLGLPVITWMAFLSLCLAIVWRRGNDVSSAPIILSVSVFIFCAALGTLRMEYALWSQGNAILESKLDTTITIAGVVAKEPDVREQVTQLYVASEKELLLVLAPRHIDVQYGDVISAEGTLQKPTSFQTELGRTFDYKGYLQARNVEYVLAFARVEVVQRKAQNTFVGSVFAFKQMFMENIEQVIPQPQAGLSHGLLLGVKQALGEDVETAFRTSGIMHIVVLSGYNIMLVIVFVMYVLSFMIPSRARIWFGLMAIVLFALMVGFSATVVRASIMASLVLIAKHIGRTYAVIRALVLTGLAMIILNPYLLLFDVGFQLSFIATLGLILLSPLIEARVSWMPKAFGLREFLTATVATQIFVTPILLYQIGEFSVVAIVVNLLVLPMVPVAMLFTFIAGIVGFVSATTALVPAYGAHVALSYILWIAQWFAALPFASFTIPPFSFVYVIFAYLLLAGLLFKLYKRGNKSAWTIVEETELRASLERKQNELPIFFR